MQELTARQQQVLDHIRLCLQQSGSPPTIRELAAHFGWRSDNSARQHLRLLAQKGCIDLDPLRARGIRLGSALQPLWLREVPLIGKVAAGRPLEAIENQEGVIGIDPRMFPETETFSLRIQGDSMVAVGIRDGDIAIVHKTPMADAGDIVVAMVNDEATVKRYLRDGDAIRLHAENPDYEDVVVQREDAFAILGVVVGIVRRL